MLCNIIFRKLLCPAMAGLILSASIPSAHAGVYYWDPNGDAADIGGPGTWSVGAAQWRQGAADGSLVASSTWTGTDNDIYYGGTTGGTLSQAVGGSYWINDITFATDGYSTTGTAVGLNFVGTTPTITANAGVTATLARPITTSTGLVKDGDGTLILGNTGSANTINATTINRGTLKITQANALGSGSVTVNSNTMLDLNGCAAANTVYLNGGTMTNSSSSLVTRSSASTSYYLMADSTVSCVGSGATAQYFNSGSLYNDGSGSYNITFVGNGYAAGLTSGRMGVTDKRSTGGTTLNNCVLNVSAKSDGSLLLSNGNLNLNDGVLVASYGSSTTATFNRSLGTGDGQVQWTGGGGFGAFAVTGLTTMTVNIGGASAGLTWNKDGFVKDGYSLIFGGADTTASGTGTVEWMNPIDLADGDSAIRTIDVECSVGAANIVRMRGVLSNSSATGLGSVNKTGAGVLALYADNTFGGATTISGGTVRLQVQNALQNSTLAPTGTGTLVFDSGVTANAFTVGGLAGSGTVTLANNAATPLGIALTVGGNNADTTYSGKIAGTAAGNRLIKTGAGVLTLSSANTFSGGVAIDGGTVKLGNTSSLGSGTVSIANNTMLDLNGQTATNTLYLNGGTLANKSSGNVTRSSSTTSYVVSSDSVVTSAGSNCQFFNTGKLTGNGKVTFVGNGYAAGLTSGRLTVGDNRTSGDTVIENGLLFIGSNTDGAGVLSSGNLTLNNAVLCVNRGTVTPSSNFNRSLGMGENQVQWIGNGGFASYNGTVLTTNIGGDAGQLAWGQQYFVQDGSSLVFGGADVSNDGIATILWENPLDLAATAGTFNRTIDVESIDSGTHRQVVQFNGALSDSVGVGSLTKTGKGTLILAGANTYTGTTNVNAGSLTLASTGSMAFDINDTGDFTKLVAASAGSVSLAGAFAFDLNDVTVPNTWDVIDAVNLTSALSGVTFAFKSGLAIAAYDNDAKLWAYNGSLGSASFDQATGMLSVTIIPEPNTIAILITGMFGLIAYTRRKQKKMNH